MTKGKIISFIGALIVLTLVVSMTGPYIYEIGYILSFIGALIVLSGLTYSFLKKRTQITEGKIIFFIGTLIVLAQVLLFFGYGYIISFIGILIVLSGLTYFFLKMTMGKKIFLIVALIISFEVIWAFADTSGYNYTQLGFFKSNFFGIITFMDGHTEFIQRKIRFDYWFQLLLLTGVISALGYYLEPILKAARKKALEENKAE